MNRVLIRKSDGFPQEFQSDNRPLGLLMQNAVNSGLDPKDYEERYITRGEYINLVEAKIKKPERDLRSAKKQAAKKRIKAKFQSGGLILTDNDLKDLRDSF